MGKTILKHYKAFRKSPPWLIKDQQAQYCFQCAKILTEWERLESLGLVRIDAKDETDNYWDIYGEPDSESDRNQIEAAISRDGCLCVYTEYRYSENDEWEWADSIGMIIDPKPLSPFSNPYVIGLMEAAIKQIKQETAAIAFEQSNMAL